MTSTIHTPPVQAQVVVNGPPIQGQEDILTTSALAFLKALHQRFNPTRLELLEERDLLQQRIDAGELPGFLPETADIRNGDWVISPVPPALQDRRVEITGPVERKMIINALNSGATMFMADLEDSNTPSWSNVIQGQINLKAAVRKTIRLTTPEKDYQLQAHTATLLVRPRGWHMEEKHLTIAGVPISASLFDFGLYFFHNAVALLENGQGPYFYLPKTESYKEARLWNAVFDFAENYLALPQGTIRATVLIETITAVFQLHEILYELRTHAAGLNCGRWDYIFSFIKKFRNVPGYLFPDRSQITMTVPFMRDYTQLVVQTCHRRNAHAIGGMAAQIPIRNNEAANRQALEKVKADKIREVTDGHDGTWVAHPGLVPIALEVFNEYMPQPNQLANKRDDFSTDAGRLLALPEGTITLAGLRMNINVGILYIESWLRGNGAAAIYHLMEDAATAEISRTQVWQWLQYKAVMDDGTIIDQSLYEKIRDEEIDNIRQLIGCDAYQQGRFPAAIRIFNRLVVQPVFASFFTTQAYEDIL
ncbi:malate synthase A [Chitinophaga nivalis]|uniref:malate synthase n=1 Tax=Chitinophaga nivalis TaxID=2991709 RepID=A0ABT3IMZ5_9BACT|nr:malate synthase A [Chitinophaga nivalis]MCW3465214.1 malate synthase A [Chitinophaga nivalis]MCW3485094.1 malate synthase A [Chitinophaga nivalis]